MSANVQTSIQTLGDVLQFMAPFAGGSVPPQNDTEYDDWVRWVQVKQEEYARRAFWRRLLTREEITLNGTTTLLPIRFHKPNGIYALIVDGEDWMDPYGSHGQYVFVETDNDPSSPTFTRWRMRFKNEVSNLQATLWYFANPPKPTQESDKILLPGDMIGYAALAEFARAGNQEGSMDKFEQDAENRFQEYLSFEVLPSKNELLAFSEPKKDRVNRTEQARAWWSHRPQRTRSV